ncbi:DUF4395 domain-containing protein [Salinispira pacifica]
MSATTAVGRFPLKVSEPVVRLIAAEVFILALLSVITASPWPAAALALDFAMRALVNPSWSPLRLIARELFYPLTKARERAVFYSPKRFAALIGFTLSLLATVAGFLGLGPLALSSAAVLALFSLLEAAFGFCAGCKIYGFLMRRRIIPVDWCPECVNF